MRHCTALIAWSELLEREFSLEIDETRRQRFGEMLARYAQKCGLSTASLLELAKDKELPPTDWAHILHIATNHETQFFRHPETINFILENCTQFDEVRVLSVGCSTGEEAYSIGAALRDAGFFRMRIHGTDISPACISRAVEGVYPAHSKISARVASSHGDGMIRFYSAFRKQFSFETHNILSDTPLQFEAPNFIVLQNVLIYYKPRTKHQILDRLSLLLPDGCYLIVGAAEDHRWHNPTMKRIKDTKVNVFQKVPCHE